MSYTLSPTTTPSLGRDLCIIDISNLLTLLLATQENLCFRSFDSHGHGHSLLSLSKLQSVLKVVRVVFPVFQIGIIKKLKGN